MARSLVGTPFVVLVLDVVVIGVSVHSAGWCSSLCACDTWYGLQHASCTGRHLYSIHTGVPNTVQALDLSNNSISLLNNYELTKAGLSQLKYLNLSANAINEIQLNAFSGLSELTVLDLSQNHLYYLLSDTFISTTNLRILRLSRNNFGSHVPKLECPWLTDLSLDSCQISHVPADTFTGLAYLRNLDLSSNLMIQLDSVALDALQFLRKLSIQGNPWSCDQLTHDLQMYLSRRSIQYQAMCANSPESKKFEKMVAYGPRIVFKYEKRRPAMNLDARNAMITTERRNGASAVATRENTTTHGNTTDKAAAGFARTLNAMSPYWFFAIGFLLGSACGVFMCYIWLTRKISCCRGYRARRASDTQRISLLQNVWQFEEPALNESGTVSCPGTPPPPYREVMLRPGLYRNPSAMANLNNLNNAQIGGARRA